MYPRDFGLIQPQSCEQIGAAEKRKEFKAQFRVHWNCPLSTSCMYEDRKLRSLFRNNKATREVTR